jgi:hypothetical protein
MNAPNKADPAIYPKMRGHALGLRLPKLPDSAIHAVIMDWRVLDGNATATALAAADGTGSIYLSSGGGFIGGGQKHPQIHEAALLAIHIALGLSSKFEFTETTDLPPIGEIYFYITTNSGMRIAIAKDTKVKDGTDSLLALYVTMQQIVTFYRLMSPQS